jgi:hypothetical protein
MRRVNTDKKEFKWSRGRFNELIHSYTLNGTELAEIFPKETKDGRIQWGFWIGRIEGHRELNTDNCKLYGKEFELSPTYPKRKDVKKKIETIIMSLLEKNEKSV